MATVPKPAAKLDDAKRHRRAVAMAREVEADETDEAFRRVTTPPNPKARR